MEAQHRETQHTTRESRFGVGRFLLRIGLLLTVIGVLLQDDFLSALGLGSLSFAGAAWIWARLCFTRLSFIRLFSEDRAFVGETVELTLEVRNNKPLPLTWLQLADRLPGHLPLDETPVPIDPVTQWGRFVTFWQPGPFSAQRRTYTLQCNHRGFHRFGPVEITSGDAFGFFQRTTRRDHEDLLIVYPEIYPAEELRLPSDYPFGAQIAEQRLIEDPLHSAGVRPWQPGDPLRRLHWKATARHQQLLSRRFETSREPQVLIALNVATLERHWEGVVHELLERTISVAASLVVLCQDHKLPVGLIANAYWPEGDQLLRRMPGRSPAQVMHVLEMLAAITGYANRPLEEVLLRERSRFPWGVTLLVVTPIAHDELLQALIDLKTQAIPVVLFTLAEKPPDGHLPGIPIYHMPHLVNDLVSPETIVSESA